MVIEPQFDEVNIFSRNRAAISINEKCGFIDKTGNVIVPPIYDQVGGFVLNVPLAIVVLDGKCGIIDTTGRLLVEPFYDAIPEISADGIVRVMRNDKWGLIDTSGRVIVEPICDKITEISHEGIATVQLNGMWGVIDDQGAVIIPITSKEELVFDSHSGRAYVIDDGNMVGFIDADPDIMNAINERRQAAYEAYDARVRNEYEAHKAMAESMPDAMTEAASSEQTSPPPILRRKVNYY